MAVHNSTDDDELLKEIRERHQYAKSNWAPIQDDAQEDMRYVAGDPWTPDDKKQRKDRPTIAPEEMAQYFNQVINQLRANPRGMHFAPVGNGANDAGSKFYQDKAREVEYRSHAKDAYIMAAENAIQRSYGFLRVNVAYESPRSVNQEIVIEPFPDPDMVLPDPDHKRPSGADMQYCFVKEWIQQSQFKREYPDASMVNFDQLQSLHPSWVQGNRVLRSEYWTIQTRKRQLVLFQSVPPTPPRHIAPIPLPPPIQTFADDVQRVMAQGLRGEIIKELREVDYPEVWMYLTNGIEILHRQKWLGKYIPIVACYGKVLYLTEKGESKKQILSMTRFGRDPWKAYSYCCSQQLEIVGQVPKASVIAPEGQLAGHEHEWAESPYVPKVWLYYKAKTSATGDQVLPPPQRLPYMQAENLQALEIVKEGFRKAIQAAMGSNFLPTLAQTRSDKSGIALDKMDQAASSGTYHFVDSFDGMILQTGRIFEDLCDKVYDYQGTTGVMEADQSSGAPARVPINTPGAVQTKGDYLVTVSSGPSSDSERTAVNGVLDNLVTMLPEIAQIAGPPVASQVLAKAIRARNGGPMMDQIADIIAPPPPMGKDGKPLPPEVQTLMGQVKQLQGLLQQAQQEKQGKVVEQQGKMQITQVQEQHQDARTAAESQTQITKAEIAAAASMSNAQAKVDAENFRSYVDAMEARLAKTLDLHLAKITQLHDSTEQAKNRVHDLNAAALEHHATMTEAQQAHEHALAMPQTPPNGGPSGA